ncbi:hypothetical protein PSMK_11460 [Phycisphaera mikurensis NBRC 102666]|uniref:Glycoside hydrolase family 5 domain-containing protein n=1 Tax=Phycisphaera mikurensis (strain NBRC 102666 / KCTC 22515 / FYK2301M01) TaxID=1142394 RepID=I0IDG7_PHYMF|nr:hypothetical protein PSMK_11460 [Phycisphaera mikurensis NBRC 102666]
MLSDRREDVVAADPQTLAAASVTLLRVFPLWSDFQPIHRLDSGRGEPFGDTIADGSPLPNREELDPAMLRRFDRFCGLAGERGLKLSVGLVTGHVSGRRFAPPGLAHLGPITSLLSMQRQVRLCRGIIGRTKHAGAIAARDLGNECNEHGKTLSREAAYAWTALLAGTSKAADPTRPLVLGVHTLRVEVDRDDAAGLASWRIDDQGERIDVLTTHPHAFWVDHAGNDPTDTLRPIAHAACETRLHADLSGRPCSAEEIGSMGPTVCDDERSADFLRASAWSLWQHGGRAAMWWYASDQDALTHPPCGWVADERKLGLVRGDGSEKPALAALGEVAEAAAGMPFGRLPARRAEAAVTLKPEQDPRAAACDAWVLARQAGLDVVYAASSGPIPDLPLRIVPSATGLTAMRAPLARELEQRARAGVRVLVAIDDAHVNDLGRVFGVHLHRRFPRPVGGGLRTELPGGRSPRLLRPLGAGALRRGRPRRGARRRARRQPRAHPAPAGRRWRHEPRRLRPSPAPGLDRARPRGRPPRAGPGRRRPGRGDGPAAARGRVVRRRRPPGQPCRRRDRRRRLRRRRNRDRPRLNLHRDPPDRGSIRPHRRAPAVRRDHTRRQPVPQLRKHRRVDLARRVAALTEGLGQLVDDLLARRVEHVAMRPRADRAPRGLAQAALHQHLALARESCRRVDRRPEARPVEVRRGHHAAELAQRRHQVDRLHERVAHTRPLPGARHQQRHPRDAVLPGEGLAPAAEVAEGLAVVAREGDDGVLRVARPRQLAEDLADPVIDLADHRVVAVQRLPPVLRVVEPGAVVGLGQRRE